MQVVTQTVGSSVLQNIVRFKDIVTGKDLEVGTKYVYEQGMSQVMTERRDASGNDRAPLRFIYRNLKTRALIQLSSFDITSFLCNGKSLEDYFTMYPDPVVTFIAPEFTILSIKHQLASGGRDFTDIGEENDDLSNPKFRYPLYAYVGYQVYKAKKDTLMAVPGTNLDTFRMSADDIKKCRESGILSEHANKHFKQINIDQPLLQVDATQVKEYEESIKQ